MAFVRRKRLSDGTLGELEKVSENSLTNEERLEKENKMLKAHGEGLDRSQMAKEERLQTVFWQKNTERDLLSISDGPFEVFWI